MLTQQQALFLCDAHEVFALLENQEEVDLLESNNPGLLEAYYSLHRLAVGAGTTTKGVDGEPAIANSEKGAS